MRKWLVLNDIQGQFYDRQVVDDLIMPWVHTQNFYGVVLNGDIIDNYQLSTFDKNPLTKEGLKVEIGFACRLMTRLYHIQKKVWIGGNHEDRTRRYVWANAPMLAEAGVVDFDRLFKCYEFGFEYLPYGAKFYIGKLMLTHGSIVRQQSGVSARAHFEKYGCSVMIGHTHRMGAYYRTNLSGEHVAYENGHLCDVSQVEYVVDPDWQQGFAVVHENEKTGEFAVQQIPILNRNHFFYGNQLVELSTKAPYSQGSALRHAIRTGDSKKGKK